MKGQLVAPGQHGYPRHIHIDLCFCEAGEKGLEKERGGRLTCAGGGGEQEETHECN